MKYIKGHDRTQTHLFPISLDDSIDSDNEVRIIDLFVDSLAVENFGFKLDHTENGRPGIQCRKLHIFKSNNNQYVLPFLRKVFF